LRANALLALDGSPGHVTEVLSGDYYQPLSTSSPHQIWSAAMVISPVLRGMFGLQFDAQAHKLTFAPHVPADWKEFTIQRVAAGKDTVNLRFARTSDSITLVAERRGSDDISLHFSPALSPGASVFGATLNGRQVPIHVEPHGDDQHAVIEATLASGTNTLKLNVRNDFSVGYVQELPKLGSSSMGLRVLSETWSNSRDTLSLETEGIAGRTYSLSVWGKEQIKSVDGARITGDAIEQSFAAGAGDREPQKQTVTIHLVNPAKNRKKQAGSQN
jgi:hypothetical protein